MDLEHLRAFVAAARYNSITSAAGRLGLSQPGLSRRIARLERDLGVELLHRGRANLEPTTAGERVLRFATAILDQDDMLRAQLATRRDGLTGHIRLCASTVPAEEVIPPLVAGFLDRHPAVTIDVTVADTGDVIEAVRSRSVDVGVGGHASEEPGLAFRPIADDEIVLAVADGHRLAGRREIAPAELARERYVAREPGSGSRRMVDEALRKAGVDPPVSPPVLSLGSTQAVISAVRAGLGVGLVSRLVLRNVTGVTGVRLSGVDAHRWLYLIHEAHCPRSPAAEAFLGHVTSMRIPLVSARSVYSGGTPSERGSHPAADG